MYIGPYHCVVISDYKTTVDAFLKNAEHHAARTELFLFNDVRNNFGITFSSGPGWQQQRRFSLRTLRDFGFGRNIMQLRILEEFQYRTERLDKQLDDYLGKPMVFEPRLFLDLLISSIINRILVGHRYDDEHWEDFKSFKYGLDREFDALTIWDLAWLNKDNYKLPGFRQRFRTTGEHQGVMLDHMRGVIKRRREEIASGLHHLDYVNGGDDYIDSYLIMYERKKEKNDFLGWFSDENLAANLADLWMAGTETTIETLLWFLIFSLNDMPVQEKLREESFAITKGNRNVELMDRPNMPYTNAVVTEVLRCASILNFNLLHETTTKTVVGDYILPEKVTVVSQISVMFKDEKDFPNPNKFDPERYMSDKDLTKQVIAFGVGKRSCVGESLARAELFLIISNFVQKYKYAPVASGPPTTDELSTLLFLRRTKNFEMLIQKVH
uniref:Unspecific monooxygenase n=1 Tax=Steinernema glaseri TaxID=37863 RepID=A0A1I8ABI7_9BILA